MKAKLRRAPLEELRVCREADGDRACRIFAVSLDVRDVRILTERSSLVHMNRRATRRVLGPVDLIQRDSLRPAAPDRHANRVSLGLGQFVRRLEQRALSSTPFCRLLFVIYLYIYQVAAYIRLR